MRVESKGAAAGTGFSGALFDIFFPPMCPLCEKALKADGLALCRACAGAFSAQLIHAPLCKVCGVPFTSGAGPDHTCGKCLEKPPPFSLARSVYVYGGEVAGAIHDFKYRGRAALAPAFAAAMAREAGSSFPAPQIIVPVPLHRGRLKKRGFNQSLLLARRIAAALSVPLDYGSLVRSFPTRPQVELKPKERLGNVAGAFSLKSPGAFKNKEVLLVDDVLTTGATVRECSKVLKKAGASGVSVLTIARVI
ncbi:MAG: double zinc ribbon domain-containing protein [Thermodesulfobacteriota bacterium]